MDEFYNQAMKILYKWLNRRSQRKSFNWDEFKRVLKRYKVLAANHGTDNIPVKFVFRNLITEASIRMKSPVREYRTPGSVRGWRSNS